jgi:hypothetical protein
MTDFFQKITEAKKAGGVAQVVKTGAEFKS